MLSKMDAVGGCRKGLQSKAMIDRESENPVEKRTREHNYNCKQILILINAFGALTGKFEIFSARCAVLEDENEKLSAKCGILQNEVAALKILSDDKDESRDDEDRNEALQNSGQETQEQRQERVQWEKAKPSKAQRKSNFSIFVGGINDGGVSNDRIQEIFGASAVKRFGPGSARVFFESKAKMDAAYTLNGKKISGFVEVVVKEYLTMEQMAKNNTADKNSTQRARPIVVKPSESSDAASTTQHSSPSSAIGNKIAAPTRSDSSANGGDRGMRPSYSDAARTAQHSSSSSATGNKPAAPMRASGVDRDTRPSSTSGNSETAPMSSAPRASGVDCDMRPSSTSGNSDTAQRQRASPNGAASEAQPDVTCAQPKAGETNASAAMKTSESQTKVITAFRGPASKVPNIRESEKEQMNLPILSNDFENIRNETMVTATDKSTRARRGKQGTQSLSQGDDSDLEANKLCDNLDALGNHLTKVRSESSKKPGGKHSVQSATQFE